MTENANNNRELPIVLPPSNEPRAERRNSIERLDTEDHIFEVSAPEIAI